nr:DMT family transporter [Desulfobacula sp.]
MTYTGELIAMATVLCWTMSVQFFEAASKRIGATPVNIIRLTFALIFFTLLLLIRSGFLVPLHFSAHAWIYLGLSGVIGFFLGDIFLFKALVEIGPRVAMLIFSLSAPTTAVIGWLFLDETYGPSQWVGMGVTLSGVGMVVLEKSRKPAGPSALTVRNISLKGVLFGIGAMLGQALGYILSKTGMKEGGRIPGCLFRHPDTGHRRLPVFPGFLLRHGEMEKCGICLKGPESGSDDRCRVRHRAFSGGVAVPSDPALSDHRHRLHLFIPGACLHYPVFHFPAQGARLRPGHGRGRHRRLRDLSAHDLI